MSVMSCASRVFRLAHYVCMSHVKVHEAPVASVATVALYRTAFTLLVSERTFFFPSPCCVLYAVSMFSPSFMEFDIFSGSKNPAGSSLGFLRELWGIEE